MADNWVSQAAGLYNAGRFDLAEKILDRALEAGQDTPALRSLRCRCLTVRQQYRDAEAEGRRALELDPANPEAFHALSWCYFKGRRIHQASEAVEEAVRLNPLETRYHEMRGLIRYARRRLPEALVCLDEALRLDPTNTSAADLKARILLHRGHTARAEAVARNALNLNPDDPSLHETLAWSHLEKNRPAEAERHFRAALTRDPMNVTAQSGLKEVTKRLVPWTWGFVLAMTSIVLAIIGAVDILPSGSTASVLVALFGVLFSLLSMMNRHLARILPRLLVILAFLGVFLIRATYATLVALQDAPPSFWKGASVVCAGTASLAALGAGLLERRRRQVGHGSGFDGG